MNRSLSLAAPLAALTCVGLLALHFSAPARPETPPAVMPLPIAPTPPPKVEPSTGAAFELILSQDGDATLDTLMRQAGVAERDRRDALASLARTVDAGDRPDVRLALDGKPGAWSIIAMTILGDVGTIRLERGWDGAFKPSFRNAVRRMPLRAGPGLYWTLRQGGLSADEAQRGSAFAARHGGGGDVEAFLGRREGRFGGKGRLELLYLEARADGAPVARSLRLGSEWIDLDRRTAAMTAPVPSRVTSSFGSRWHPILHFLRPHNGVDFAARAGTPIVAASDGTVGAAHWRGGYGRQVVLDHGRGLESSYSHLQAMTVVPGQQVRRGQVIGTAGSSGLATGPHLHFEVRRHGRAVDPMAVGLGHRDSPLTRADVRQRLRSIGVHSA